MNEKKYLKIIEFFFVSKRMKKKKITKKSLETFLKLYFTHRWNSHKYIGGRVNLKTKTNNVPIIQF